MSGNVSKMVEADGDGLMSDEGYLRHKNMFKIKLSGLWSPNECPFTLVVLGCFSTCCSCAHY